MIVLSITFRVHYDIKHHDKMLEEKVANLIHSISFRFDQEIHYLNNRYSSIANFYSKNREDITALVLQRQREKLHQKILQDYQLFKTFDPSLYVMHFFDQNNTTILRMYKPSSYGDNLTDIRPIVRYVNQKVEVSHGFEVGKNGITYRITNPLFFNHKHIGILEFGIKPKYFVDILKKNFHIEAQILIKTDALKVLLQQKPFQEVGEYSLIYRNHSASNQKMI